MRILLKTVMIRFLKVIIMGSNGCFVLDICTFCRTYTYICTCVFYVYVWGVFQKREKNLSTIIMGGN